MPVSNTHNIPLIFDAISAYGKGATSFLDVGAGFGKYGVLLREQFDAKFRGRYQKGEWKSKIDAVEIWQPYITTLHTYIYDHIYVKDVSDIAGSLHKYDIILMIEILEHLSEETGRRTLQTLKKKCNMAMILSFPWFLKGNEGKGWENSHERHVSLWNLAKLIEIFGEKAVIKLNRQVYVVNAQEK